jgi:hypothetical protein
MPALNPMLDKAAATYETLTLDDLRQAVSRPLSEIGHRFRGLVIENLSIDPTSRLTPLQNGSRWIDVTDQARNKARVCIPPAAWSRAVEKGYLITKEVAIDVALNALTLDRWSRLQIIALAIRVAGQSKTEALRARIIAYCEHHNYFHRPRKKLPVIIRKVAIITTESSTIASDITNQIGIRKEFIGDYRFDGTVPALKNIICELSRRGAHDILVLYRGGREDEFMFVFSDPAVLDAVVRSHVPVVTALGHDRDHPPVQAVADMGFASPTRFAAFVRQRNQDALDQAGLCLKNIEHHYGNCILAIENNVQLLIGSIDAIASDLLRQHEAGQHRRHLIWTVFIAALILLAVIAFFILKIQANAG